MNTKFIGRVVASTVVIMTLVASPLNAEYPYCCQGNQYNSRQNYPRYDTQKVETLDGEIIRLDDPQSRRGNFSGTHLMMQTAQETIEVHVAPSWYLAQENFDLETQEEIVVIGSRIDFAGEPAIIAREIRKGNETLVLRDENGIPLWRGRNQQQ